MLFIACPPPSGVAVLPGVISKDKAAAYVSRAHDWLESFDLGYDRADPSTWKIEHLPANWHGGLYATNGICHSQLAWDIRQEAGVIDAFKTIWGTDELLVSFGASGSSLAAASRGDPVTRADPPRPSQRRSSSRARRRP